MADKAMLPNEPAESCVSFGHNHAAHIDAINVRLDALTARLDALAGQLADHIRHFHAPPSFTGQPEPAAEPTTHGVLSQEELDEILEPPQAEPRTHDLKCWPKYFKALRDGTKTFELRLNDQDYRVGDVLLIREWNQHRKAYTGEVERRRVTYLLKADDGPFLMDGFCCMGLASYGAPADPPAEDREALPCPVCGEPAVSIGDCISCANPDCGLNDSNNCLDRDTWDALPRRAAVRAAVLDEVEQALTKLPCRPIDAHAHLVFHDLLAALRQKEGQ